MTITESRVYYEVNWRHLRPAGKRSLQGETYLLSLHTPRSLYNHIVHRIHSTDMLPPFGIGNSNAHLCADAVHLHVTPAQSAFSVVSLSLQP